MTMDENWKEAEELLVMVRVVTVAVLWCEVAKSMRNNVWLRRKVQPKLRDRLKKKITAEATQGKPRRPPTTLPRLLLSPLLGRRGPFLPVLLPPQASAIREPALLLL